MREWWQDILLHTGSGVFAAFIVALVGTEAAKPWGLFEPNREVDWDGLEEFLPAAIAVAAGGIPDPPIELVGWRDGPLATSIAGG